MNIESGSPVTVDDFTSVDPVTNTIVNDVVAPKRMMLGSGYNPGSGWDLGDSEEGEIIGGGD